MTFDEWFEAAHPITSLTNMSLRFAHHELARLAWEAALRHPEPAQAQASDAEVFAALGVYEEMSGEDAVFNDMRAALEAAARARLSAPLPDGRS